ncbi:hypothetical protein [Burkholderia ubonensis]|uniref:hypothetical protein n=1 Tax=Burkholderia ubonensis TaxID=101571 RepID=UPI000F57B650|nr:hypothetical protein DF155_14245 [Burkholderia ubonensis]RQP37325.1 hypothetical protein DF154_19595 [Burkholderia ubonensis]RQP40932.1 hypothetical protein DF156_15555 [Burkholderia ubonensis]RQP52749.1 hypothetical protein DF159_29475 [Burkholderia ubonensis]RQP54328.1 hypothetical protein DF144_15450 [Burkholderia ubonensis]
MDGVQFSRFIGTLIEQRYGANRALSISTEDEALAHAGPWLVDLVNESSSQSSLYGGSGLLVRKGGTHNYCVEHRTSGRKSRTPPTPACRTNRSTGASSLTERKSGF